VRRGAFSLVEMILVMALLVIVAAITIPYTESIFREGKPRAAADAFRAALLRARTAAMEQGRAYRVGIVPNDGAFRIAPDDDSYWTGSGTGSSVGQGSMPPVREAWYLPHDITFGGGPGDVPTVEPAMAAKQARPDPNSIDASQFVPWVVFFSDGTAEADQEITFRTGSGGGPGLAVTLRAMTGVTTVRKPAAQAAPTVSPGAKTP